MRIHSWVIFKVRPLDCFLHLVFACLCLFFSFLTCNKVSSDGERVFVGARLFSTKLVSWSLKRAKELLMSNGKLTPHCLDEVAKLYRCPACYCSIFLSFV